MVKTRVNQKCSQVCRLKYPAIIILAALLIILALLWAIQKPVTACEAKNITMTQGQKSGAAGTIYQNIEFKNSGKITCTLSGFPAAFLYGSNGYAVGNGASPRPTPNTQTVTLKPGQTAHTVLGYPNPGNFDPGICSGTSTALKLYIPGETTPLQMPLTESWCPGFSSSAIESGE